MKALHLKPEPVLLENTPAPIPAAGEALIGLRMAGVCDTDLQLARGYMDFRGIPGHEFVGDVLACDDSRWLGKRVVGDINAGCGKCRDCVEALGHHCASRDVLGIVGRPGCFAEQFTLPVRNLVEVPDHVADEVAVFAEPLAAGLHVVEELAEQPGQRVAVLGDGKLGLLTALALHAAGHAVSLIGHHDSKLDLARQAGLRGLLESELADQDTHFDLVVEATGNPRGLERALQLVRPRGQVILKSTVAGKFEIDLAPLVIHEIRLIGSRCGNMREAMQLLASGKINPEPLVTATYPLAAAVEALQHGGRKGAMKVLITAK
jgi:2-desacetyl-2-hydroxyethyl bacteriochlorophyllide A dehydrogenase